MRTQFSKIVLAAAFALALALTFGCSSDDKPDDGGGSGDSTQANVVYGADVTYEGETYKTVVIGSQTWFQRNLNYAVEGSKCGDGSSLSSTNTATCNTYGRLYDWVTAMKLPTSCKTSSCATSISTPHQGICPSGWHIPSDADWDKLYRYADGTSGTSSLYYSPTAGRYLKARNGWNSNGNGEDKFGFAALPGGSGFSGFNSFDEVGDYGYWWSASEASVYSAYYRYMIYDGEYADWGSSDFKSYSRSVRCVKD